MPSILRARILFIKSDPGEARTLAPLIKSHLLYQLSYGVRKGHKITPVILQSRMENFGGEIGFLL